jgi:hypothetical protein
MGVVNTMVWKKALSIGLMGTLLWSSMAGIYSTKTVAENHSNKSSDSTVAIQSMFDTLKLVKEEPITSGAILKQYIWSTNRGPVKINVVEVDLENPYVKLDAIAGKGGKVALRDNVSDLAKETGAIAASNADFFVIKGDGAPLGVQMTEGEWVSSPAYLNGIYSLGVTTDHKAWIDQLTFNGTVKGPKGDSFPLSGLNKSMYWQDPNSKPSHVDALHLYTSAWGKRVRGSGTYTTPTEVLIKDGIVQEVSINKALDIAPPEGTDILRGHGKAAAFLNEWQVGDSVHVDYQILPEKDWKMVIGGHGLLVDEGKAVPYTRDPSSVAGYRARTAIGYKKDQQVVDIVTVEGNSEESVGMSLDQLAQFMAHIGVWRGVNMDGGGSTTMVARPLGETSVTPILRPEHETERLVPNAMGVYSTAPKGQLTGLKIKGPRLVFLNENAKYEAFGYDNFYNPSDISGKPIQWGMDKQLGSFDKQRFTPTFPGKSRVVATVGNAKGSLEVEVIGRKSISEMSMKPSALILSPGETVQLTVTATTLSGERRRVPMSEIKWEVHGVSAVIQQDGKMAIKDNPALKQGFIVGRYDQYSAVVPVTVAQERKMIDFEAPLESLFESNASSVKGSFTVDSDPSQMGNHIGVLNYSFTEGTGTKIAYARLGQQGYPIEGAPIGLKLRVRGDKGLHWLRAEVTDASGKLHRLDLADSVNWDGWKTIDIPLSGENMHFPIRLDRIYLANLEQGQDERSFEGSIAIDDISFKYGKEPVSDQPVTIDLAIGKPYMTVSGADTNLQQSPIILGQTTYVPVRDLSQILGAKVLYQHTTRRVSFYKESSWVDLWQNDEQMIVNGKSQSLATPVKNRNGVTMVPLRVISESFGLKVHWNGATRSITLNK